MSVSEGKCKCECGSVIARECVSVCECESEIECVWISTEWLP